jgi:hypothetical protein
MPILLLTRTDRERGAALLEVLVSIAVAGLVIGAVGLALPAFRSQASLNMVVRQAEQFLLTARREAMTYQSRVEVHFMKGQWQVVPQGQKLDLSRFEGKIDIISAQEFRTQGHDRLILLPDGRSSGLRIRLSQASRETMIDVHWADGRVRRHGR